MELARPHLSSSSGRSRLLAAVGILAAILFVVGHNQDIYWLRTIAKPIPVLCMAAWVAWLPVQGRYQRAIFAGLLLSALADVLLEALAATFLLGLIVFLLAHIAYIVAFTTDSRGLFIGRALLAYGYGIVIYTILFTRGNLGDLTIPVLFYVIVICTMLWRAGSRVGVPDILVFSARAALVGALLFTLSDTLLAYNRFVEPIALARYGVITTYWLGQLGIALSAWRSPTTPLSQA
ncbi:MAG: lysoplasmalogenase [Caldilineales bacterium]|nr:lysoplasmalogenase [Caldilineales bacterium]